MMSLQSYDTVIIGSGLGGLFSAGYLGNLGLKVKIIESHNKLGGLATWYFRLNKHFLFSVSPHLIPKSTIKYVRKAFGDEVSSLIRPYKEVYIHDNTLEKIDYEQDQFHSFLKSKFPDSFMEKIESLKNENLNLSIKDFSNSLGPEKENFLKYFFLPLSHAKGLSLNAPVLVLFKTLDFFIESGIYHFGENILETMKKIKNSLLAKNVNFSLGEPVTSITKNDNSYEIIVKKKKIIAKSIIWNGSLSDLSRLTLKSEKLKHLDLSASSSFTQSVIGLTSPLSKFKNHIIFNNGQRHKNGYFFYDEKFKTLVYTTQDCFSNWKDLDEHEKIKQKSEMARTTLELAKKIYGDFTPQFQEVSTPLTVYRYTRNINGASFGHRGLEESLIKEIEKDFPGIFCCFAMGEEFTGWLGLAKLAKIKVNDCQDFLIGQT
mgnify:CR=1 FL=1